MNAYDKKYMVLGRRTGSPYFFRRKYFGGFIIGLNGLASLWINKYGFTLSFPKPFTILRWIEIEMEWPWPTGFWDSGFSFVIWKEGFTIFRYPKLKWV